MKPTWKTFIHTYDADEDVPERKETVYILTLNEPNSIVYLNVKVTHAYDADLLQKYWLIYVNNSYEGRYQGSFEEVKQLAVKILAKYIPQVQSILDNFREL